MAASPARYRTSRVANDTVLVTTCAVADDASAFDFSANYVVLNFATPPPLAASAALFERVGRIDPELFATDTSGYTQYGRAYLSLQSAVTNERFIEGYVRAAAAFGVEYTPVINGMPSLFQGGAAFPGNDWTASPRGEEYLSRIPARSHRALARIRAFHLRVPEVRQRCRPGSSRRASTRGAAERTQ